MFIVLLRGHHFFVLAVSFFLMTAVQAESFVISVDVKGAPEGKNETLLSGLSIVQQQTSTRLSARRIHSLHEQAADELSQILAVYGYYNVKVTSEIKQNGDKWLASYQLNLGDPVKIEKVTVLSLIHI